MARRTVPLLAALLVTVAWHSTAVAQETRFKLGGGAGFAYFADPEFDLARAADLGGYIGFRFNDNVSVEIDFSFGRSKRLFTEEGEPAQDELAPFARFELQSTRYRLDGVLLYNLGRRQPFHPFVFGGAGLEREVIGLRRSLTAGSEVETIDVDYLPLTTLGAGFDFYVLHNTAARFEYRWWIPPTKIDRRTSRIFFVASYFF
jgi:hypothetical protein